MSTVKGKAALSHGFGTETCSQGVVLEVLSGGDKIGVGSRSGVPCNLIGEPEFENWVVFKLWWLWWVAAGDGGLVARVVLGSKASVGGV